MKKNIHIIFISGLILLTGTNSCRIPGAGTKDTGTQVQELFTNMNGNGVALELNLVKGKSFNHPTFAVWLEDTSGQFIQTLFVTRSFGKGIFTYGDPSGGNWKSGEVRRPAALPYWSHKAGISSGIQNYVPDKNHPVPDGLTGATPQGSFVLKTRGNAQNPELVNVLLEINQTWDWNTSWTNNKYPGDREYKTSSQPAVVYSATIDRSKPGSPVELLPVGRSSYNGSDGKLYSDLETLTTALKIVEKITVTVRGEK
jgi:hypothetical protein